MTQNTIVNQHIHEFLKYYIIELDQPEYAVLLSGKWGSGKTFFINQVTNKYQNEKNIVKVSLFGLKSKEDIHKQVLLKLFNIDDIHDVSVTAKLVGHVLKKFTGINLSDMPMGWALKQEGNQNAIFIFDDLERAGIELLELHGYINGLTETHKQKVILLADEEKLNEDEKYLLFKEKTIGKTFQIEQDFETAFKTFIDKLKNAKEILSSNQSIIKTVFDTAGYKNLRSLRQTMLDFDHLLEKFEQKFKDHTELMSEIIQIFFAFSLEIKSNSLDITTLASLSELRVERMHLNEKNDSEETEIEKLYRKYDFINFDSLLFPNALWIELFSTYFITSQQITESLNKSRYFFREQKEEWVMLWHYMWIEEDEFQTALNQTLVKLEKNEYLEPTVIMQVLGIFLELIDKKIYNRTKDQVVNDIKKYVDVNIKELEGIYTLSDYELDGHYAYYGYRSEESGEFKYIKDYLVEQADHLRNEGLEEKGNYIIKCLNENNIEEFTNMLSVERNKEILYRLPVLNAINPQDFFDALLQVKNKNMRDVLGVLKNRYSLIFSDDQEGLISEIEFWKSLIEIVNSYEIELPYKIKDVWIKKHCYDVVEKEIIQKIENEIERKSKIKQLEVTALEQSNN